jgi:hypothetical protein
MQESGISESGVFEGVPGVWLRCGRVGAECCCCVARLNWTGVRQNGGQMAARCQSTFAGDAERIANLKGLVECLVSESRH